MLKESKETDEALMAKDCWHALGAKPFEDEFTPADKSISEDDKPQV